MGWIMIKHVLYKNDFKSLTTSLVSAGDQSVIKTYMYNYCKYQLAFLLLSHNLGNLSKRAI